MEVKQIVAQAIEDERSFQDQKWGTIKEHPHTIYEWIGIMEQELKEAKEAFFQRPANESMLAEIIQVVAVGHACLEQHCKKQKHLFPDNKDFSNRPEEPSTKLKDVLNIGSRL